MLQKEKEDIERLVGVINGNIAFFEELYKKGNQVLSLKVPSKQNQITQKKGGGGYVFDFTTITVVLLVFSN